MKAVRFGICGILVLACWTGLNCHVGAARAVEPAIEAHDDDGDFARKADIMHGPRWQRTIAEFGRWLATQTVYSAADVQRIKRQFNARVAAMSSYELEYLLDSISAKLQLLDTPERGTPRPGSANTSPRCPTPEGPRRSAAFQICST